MKKELKAVCGLILAIAAALSAGRAGAEISIGMEPAAYSVRPAGWGQVSQPSSTDRLSAAAESLAEAARSGDNAGAETLLAGLFSGAVKKEAAAPVYAEKKQAAPAPAAPAPARVKRSARATSKSAHVTEADWVLIAQEADATEEAPAAKEKDDKDGADKPEAAAVEGVSNMEQAAADYAADFGVSNEGEAKPEQSLWQTLLGGGIGMLLVILLILLL